MDILDSDLEMWVIGILLNSLPNAMKFTVNISHWGTSIVANMARDGQCVESRLFDLTQKGGGIMISSAFQQKTSSQDLDLFPNKLQKNLFR
jgi:hypothetical protein